MVSRACLIGLIALLMSGMARAQTTGEGSLAFGAGGYSNGVSSGGVAQFGGGGEAVVHRRFGIGGDVLLSGGGGDAWLESSLRTSYRFPRLGSAQRVEPFVSGGYTLLGGLTGGGGLNGGNIGAGLTYWFGHEGVRIEFRDVAFSNGFRDTQYWTARVSIAFR